MKVFICTLTLFLITANVSGDHRAEKKKIFEECKTEVGITDEMKGKKMDPEDPKFKCLMTCIEKKIGHCLENDKCAPEKCTEFIEKKKHTKVDDKMKENIKICCEMANQLSECEVVPSMKKCFMEKGVFPKRKHHHKNPHPHPSSTQAPAEETETAKSE